MNRQTWSRVLVIAAVLTTIVINGLANALPLNNLTTGEISNRFEVYFVPAGYVFSIWGVIYIGLIAFAIFQVAHAPIYSYPEAWRNVVRRSDCL